MGTTWPPLCYRRRVVPTACASLYFDSIRPAQPHSPDRICTPPVCIIYPSQPGSDGKVSRRLSSCQSSNPCGTGGSSNYSSHCAPFGCISLPPLSWPASDLPRSLWRGHLPVHLPLAILSTGQPNTASVSVHAFTFPEHPFSLSLLVSARQWLSQFSRNDNLVLISCGPPPSVPSIVAFSRSLLPSQQVDCVGSIRHWALRRWPATARQPSWRASPAWPLSHQSPQQHSFLFFIY